MEILLLVLRPVMTLPCDVSLLPPRFRAVTPSPASGVTLLRLDRVAVTDCGSCSFSGLSLRSTILDELSRVLRRCGDCGVFVVVELDRFDLVGNFVILRGEPPIPGVGVELVTSFNGDLSNSRDGLKRSIVSWTLRGL